MQSAYFVPYSYWSSEQQMCSNKANVTGFLTGIATMSAFQWHLSVAWVELYAMYPTYTTGMGKEMTARQAPDFLLSDLSLLIVIALMFLLALLLTLVFRGRVIMATYALAVGSWLVPVVIAAINPEIYDGQFSFMGVVIYSMIVAGMIGFPVLLGALFGTFINWVTSTFAK